MQTTIEYDQLEAVKHDAVLLADDHMDQFVAVNKQEFWAGTRAPLELHQNPASRPLGSRRFPQTNVCYGFPYIRSSCFFGAIASRIEDSELTQKRVGDPPFINLKGIWCLRLYWVILFQW